LQLKVVVVNALGIKCGLPTQPCRIGVLQRQNREDLPALGYICPVRPSVGWVIKISGIDTQLKI
jgi:hypothetical protein